MKEQQVRAFILELTELTRKHGVTIEAVANADYGDCSAALELTEARSASDLRSGYRLKSGEIYWVSADSCLYEWDAEMIVR